MSLPNDSSTMAASWLCATLKIWAFPPFRLTSSSPCIFWGPRDEMQLSCLWALLFVLLTRWELTGGMSMRASASPNTRRVSEFGKCCAC
ncbi:hypothetical protein FOVG_19674 [Fusarium oxysporum f. sp. pisi HDV247]|uniref:Uncharacterized protein n=1 Tax=Fusarium oxysporum f. sp. pisi HDV247 TaxID=1080344 RepID=W9N7X3_FUSOX|nr:hypothetical protein FOVG_19674 [Fusarium oxysporum f. sp. pisi HDV247]